MHTSKTRRFDISRHTLNNASASFIAITVALSAPADAPSQQTVLLTFLVFRYSVSAFATPAPYAPFAPPPLNITQSKVMDFPVLSLPRASRREKPQKTLPTQCTFVLRIKLRIRSPDV